MFVGLLGISYVFFIGFSYLFRRDRRSYAAPAEPKLSPYDFLGWTSTSTTTAFCVNCLDPGFGGPGGGFGAAGGGFSGSRVVEVVASHYCY